MSENFYGRSAKGSPAEWRFSWKWNRLVAVSLEINPIFHDQWLIFWSLLFVFVPKCCNLKPSDKTGIHLWLLTLFRSLF